MCHTTYYYSYSGNYFSCSVSWPVWKTGRRQHFPLTPVWYSVKVSHHQHGAWGGRSSWKVQHRHTGMQTCCGSEDNGLCLQLGRSQVRASLRTHLVTLSLSAAQFRSEPEQIKSRILSLNIFIETLKLRYLNYILAVPQERRWPAPIDAHISRPNERQNGDSRINGSVPNFPQPPSSNQII